MATIEDLMEEIQLIKDVLNETQKYVTYIYNQKSNDPSYIYTLEVPITRIVPDTIIYYVPIKMSLDIQGNFINILRIKHGSSVAIDYPIYFEDVDGQLKMIQSNAIVPNKTCMFRLQKTAKRAILINATMEDTAKVKNLVVSNSSYFRNEPRVYTNPLQIHATSERLVKESEATTIANNQAQAFFNQKFLYGTDDPETALSQAPNDTIYFQLEDIDA